MKSGHVFTYGLTLALATNLVACKVPAPDSTVQSVGTAAPTSGGGVEGQMSAAMREFRDKFVAMETADDVDAMILSLKTKLQANQLADNDIKLLAAQLVPLYNMRGIIYRLKAIVEQSGGRTFHSLIVTSLMQVATGARIFKPAATSQGTNAWNAINHFFAYPYKGMQSRIAAEGGHAGQDGTGAPAAGASLADAGSVKFASVAAFQTWLAAVVLPDLNAAITQVSGISIPDGSPAVWDNQIIYGRGSFGNDSDLHDRFVSIREPERKLILAGLYSMRHNLYFFTSYNYEKFPSMVQAIGQLVGMDGFFGSDVTGLSARDRAQVICPSRGKGGNDCAGKYQDLFTKTSSAGVNMPKAYNDLAQSVNLVKDAWEGLKGRNQSQDDYQLLDPAKIVPWQRINQATVDNLVALINGQPVRSAVTGKLSQVNVKAFYANPPDDMKAFMPVGFDSAGRTLQPIDTFTDIRNYEYGESTEWDPQVYRTYFPDVKDGSEVPTVMKDLAQTWGGWLVNTPLATVSMVF